MPKRKLKTFSPNTIQVIILQTLRDGGLLGQVENDDFYLINANGNIIPPSLSEYRFAIYKLINKSFIKRKKTTAMTLPNSEEAVMIDTYAITDKGLNVNHDIKARLRI